MCTWSRVYLPRGLGGRELVRGGESGPGEEGYGEIREREGGGGIGGKRGCWRPGRAV